MPHIIAGADLAAEAQAGSGKTAAFVLPISQNMAAVAADSLPSSIGVVYHHANP
jgi:superfamily II DNA/RNA helicase